MAQPAGAAPVAAPTTRTSPTIGRVVGAALLLPAVVLTVLQLLVPSVRTMWLSLHKSSRPGSGGEFVGLDNYLVWTHDAARALGGGFALVLPPVAVAAIGGVLIALSVRGSALARLGSRIVIGGLLTAFVPVGVAWSLFTVLGPDRLSHVVLIMMAALTPALTALFAIILSAVLRRWDRSGPLTLAVVGVITLGATIAGAVQVFDIPYLTGNAKHSPAALAIRMTFAELRTGRAAAVNTVLLVLAGLIGIGVTAVALAARLRFSLGREGPPGARPAPRPSALGYLGLGIALLAALVTLAAMAMWWYGMFNPEAIRAAGARSVLEAAVNTWLPTFVGTVIQVVVAGLAGFGIGWLRPLGHRSRWLLLFFSPWLLVAVATLAPAWFLAARTGHHLDTWAFQLPRSWVAVPLLMVSALVFDALRERRDRLGSAGGSAVVAGTGVIVLAAGITLVTQAVGLAWALVASSSHPNAVMLLSMTYSRSMGGAPVPQQALMPLPVLWVLLTVSLTIQVLCAPMVRLTTGRAQARSSAGQAQTWPSRTSSAASRSSS